LALAFESRLSKQQILISYLERVSFAPQVIGLRAAALQFFQREPHYLTIDQGLQLVQSIYDPESYNPSVSAMPAEVRRRRAVIAGMARVYAARLGEEVAVLSVLRGR
jgi:membrane peptidoglycan carboxypeptidase